MKKIYIKILAHSALENIFKKVTLWGPGSKYKKKFWMSSKIYKISVRMSPRKFHKSMLRKKSTEIQHLKVLENCMKINALDSACTQKEKYIKNNAPGSSKTYTYL